MAVQATVTMSVGVDLTKLVSTKTSVTANFYVEFKGNSKGIPCIIALGSSGTGVTLSGGTTITANTCAVSSNSATAPAITVPDGTTVTTPVASTPAALTSTQKANIKPPSGTASVPYRAKSVSVPLASKIAVTSAVSHLTSVGSMSNPTFAAPPVGTDITFDYSSSGKVFPPGCNGYFNGSSTWTVMCTGAGPFNFKNFV